MTLLGACSAPSDASTPASGGGAAHDDTSDGSAGRQGAVDFCAARTVLRDKCQRCHAEPTQNGAPFALLTYADTQVVERNGAMRFEKMRDAVESDYMPPGFLKLMPPVEPLSALEKATLLEWLAGQPPLDATDCD